MAIAFTDDWARAWGDALNGSATYREAAATWEGSIAVVVDDGAGAPGPAVFLDIWHGQCRAARLATITDIGTADYVLEAAPTVWKDVLSATLSPAMALITGQVRLGRGELTRLLPYSAAAKALVDLAGQLQTEFPEGGDTQWFSNRAGPGSVAK